MVMIVTVWIIGKVLRPKSKISVFLSTNQITGLISSVLQTCLKLMDRSESKARKFKIEGCAPPFFVLGI